MNLGEIAGFLFKLALSCLIIGIVFGVVLSGRLAHIPMSLLAPAEAMQALLPGLAVWP